MIASNARKVSLTAGATAVVTVPDTKAIWRAHELHAASIQMFFSWRMRRDPTLTREEAAALEVVATVLVVAGR